MIDLDLLVPVQEVTEALPVNLRRRWLTAGTLLAVLLFAAGATVPPRPGLPAVRTATLVNTATYRILGDALLVAESRPDGNWVTAYPLAPGPARWTTQVGVVSDAVGMDAVADVILVSMVEPQVTGDHTVALDRRTGAVRWHSPLILASIDRTRGRAVLTEYLATGLGGGPPPARIAVVDAATGASVWGYVREGACQADVPYTVSRPGTGVAVLCQDGTLSVLDLGTGRVRAQVNIGSGGRVDTLPDRIVVSSLSAGGTTLSGYDEDTLRRRWTVDIEQGNYGIVNCGSRVCVGNSTIELALDRDTGRLVWQVRGIGFATPLSDRYVLVAPAALGDVELVDADTGQAVMQLGSWTVEPASVAPLMFYQSDGATGHTWLARLPLGATAVEVLGFVPGARAETCGSSGGYVVCRTVNSTIGVWRYRG